MTLTSTDLSCQIPPLDDFIVHDKNRLLRSSSTWTVGGEFCMFPNFPDDSSPTILKFHAQKITHVLHLPPSDQTISRPFSGTWGPFWLHCHSILSKVSETIISGQLCLLFGCQDLPIDRQNGFLPLSYRRPINCRRILSDLLCSITTEKLTCSPWASLWSSTEFGIVFCWCYLHSVFIRLSYHGFYVFSASESSSESMGFCFNHLWMPLLSKVPRLPPTLFLPLTNDLPLIFNSLYCFADCATLAAFATLPLTKPPLTSMIIALFSGHHFLPM